MNLYNRYITCIKFCACDTNLIMMHPLRRVDHNYSPRGGGGGGGDLLFIYRYIHASKDAVPKESNRIVEEVIRSKCIVVYLV